MDKKLAIIFLIVATIFMFMAATIKDYTYCMLTIGLAEIFAVISLLCYLNYRH